MSLQKELNFIETLFERGQQRGDFLNPRAFLVKSEYDLITNKTQVLKAIEKWRSIHPLLNARIIKQGDKYFKVFDEPNTIKNEIQFIRYESDAKEEYVNCWKLFFERELTINFKSDEAIWRLFFIQLATPNEFCVLFNIHHSITDGRNAFAVVQQLMKIIEDFMESGVSMEINEQSQFEIDFDVKDQLIVDDQMPSPPPPEFPPPKVIYDFMMPKENTFNDSLSDYEGRFMSENDKELVKAQDIIQNRVNHHSRLKWVNISNEDFVYLTVKCKEHGLKLTGFFELVTAFAWYRALHKHSQDSDFKLKLNYAVTVNMRPFFSPKFNYTTMGDLMNAFMSDLTFESNQMKADEFWTRAKACTTRLHDYLDKRIFLNKKITEEMEKMFEYFDFFTLKEPGSYYALTNIGKLEPYASGSFGKIKIEQYFSSCSFTKEPSFNVAFISICSIENSLLWAISYDSFYFKQDLVDDWIHEIHALIRQFI